MKIILNELTMTLLLPQQNFLIHIPFLKINL